jgi:Na+-transporting NADH:ubiquinone oxidoreductase subunit NqrC
MAEKTVWLTIRRLILVVLTILVSITVLSSLLNNLSQPQVQSRLELYQANFILQAAELNEKADYASVAFLGDNPYQNVQNQYEEAIEAEQANLTRLQAQLEDTQKGASAEPVSELGISVANLEQTEKLKDAIAQTQNRLDRQNLCLGLIQVQQNNITVAQALWQNLSASATEN